MVAMTTGGAEPLALTSSHTHTHTHTCIGRDGGSARAYNSPTCTINTYACVYDIILRLCCHLSSQNET